MNRSSRGAWLAGGILLVSGGITAFLILSREAPEREEPASKGTLVETVTVRREAHRLDVRGRGSVQATSRVTVVPQVAGVVVDANPNLTPGGIVREGDLLFHIDPRDYEVAVARAEAAVAQAEARLQLEQGRQRVAREEWRLFEGEVDAELRDSSLALREPQLASARAEVQAGRAQLAQAKLDLERTRVTVPYDALILQESIEPGQYVAPGGAVMTLMGIHKFRVQLAIPVDHVPYVDVPFLNADAGSRAHIRYDAGTAESVWEGRVTRLLGELDPAGRLARLLIEGPHPWATTGCDQVPLDRVPLLVDAYVEGVIEGNRTEQWIEVAREAVYGGAEVHVLTRTNTLRIQPIEIGWRRPDTVLVKKGLEDGDQVVISRIAAPVEGMRLRTERASDKPAPGASEDGASTEAEGRDDA